MAATTPGGEAPDCPKLHLKSMPGKVKTAPPQGFPEMAEAVDQLNFKNLKAVERFFIATTTQAQFLLNHFEYTNTVGASEHPWQWPPSR